MERYKRWFNKFCGCCICACCSRLPCFKKSNTVTPVNNGDPVTGGLFLEIIIDYLNLTNLRNTLCFLEHMEPINREEEDQDTNSFLNKDKKKEIDNERRKKKLFEQKENMKKIQEKNTVQAPKNILHRCFPLFAYK